MIQSNKDVFDYLLKMNSTKEGIEQTKFEEIISTKYNKFSHLLGGIIMILIGILLLLRPEWLMFNFK